jgi:hypothetical protein
MLTYADLCTSGQASKAAELGMSLEQVLKKKIKLNVLKYLTLDTLISTGGAGHVAFFFLEQYKEQLAAKASYTSS